MNYQRFLSQLMGQDSLVHSSFGRNYMPMLYVPYRHRALRVRSFALPVALKEIPLVKSVSLVLTRSEGAHVLTFAGLHQLSPCCCIPVLQPHQRCLLSIICSATSSGVFVRAPDGRQAVDATDLLLLAGCLP